MDGHRWRMDQKSELRVNMVNSTYKCEGGGNILSGGVLNQIGNNMCGKLEMENEKN